MKLINKFGFSTLEFSKVKILWSSVNNIHYNLALEEYLYRHELMDCPLLLIWRNDRNVVIGRHQNPWKECHLQEMEKDGVLLSRRKSGGGAVYQDLGNSCFTFITPVAPEDLPLNEKELNFKIILNTLERLGIKGQISGRNDVLVGDRKVSGSAFQVSLGRKGGEGRMTLHHGTMLLSLDKEKATSYLNVNKEKLKSKGVESVKSRIMNLCELKPEISHESFSFALKEEFQEVYKGLHVEERSFELQDMPINSKVEEMYNELTSKDWLYGSTPSFSNNLEKRFEFGLFDLHFDVEKGIITRGKVYSDSLFVQYVDCMNEILNSGNVSYDFDGMKSFADSLKEKFPELTDNTIDIERWLISSI